MSDRIHRIARITDEMAEDIAAGCNLGDLQRNLADDLLRERELLASCRRALWLLIDWVQPGVNDKTARDCYNRAYHVAKRHHPPDRSSPICPCLDCDGVEP